MKLNIVPARTGVIWARQGLQAFARAPVALTALFFFFFSTGWLVTQLPLIGAVLIPMMSPAATLGFMAAAAWVDDSAHPSAAAPNVFTAAIQAIVRSMRPLLVLGLVYALGSLAAIGLSALIDGGEYAQACFVGTDKSPEELMRNADFRAAWGFSIGLSILLSLAFWYAPALVHWYRVPPMKSIFFSTIAYFRNLRAFAMLTLVWTAYGLMSGLVVAMLLPVANAIGGQYAVLMTSAVLFAVMAAYAATTTWFTFRDTFSAD